MMPATAPPPNWYPDNADSALQRWWDGERWTTHTAPRAAFAPGASLAPSGAGQYAYSNPVITAGKNSIATRAFVYSLIGLVINPLGMMSIGAIVLGIRGLRRAPQYAAEYDRHGLAIAAIVIGVIGGILTIFWIVSAISVYAARNAFGG